MSPSHLPITERGSVFAPLDQRGRVGAVEQRLVDAIQLGLFADGEQLPSGPDLAARLGVALVTLREALGGLRRKGLVETRRGRGGGTFVRAPAGWAREALLERFTQQPLDELRDLGDLRLAVEGAAARLAAQRQSPADVARLRSHVEALAGAASDSDRRRADARFHLELATTARSRRLSEATAQIHAQLGPFLWFAIEDDEPPDAVDDHRALVAAVADRDEQLASRLAAEHVHRETRRLVEHRLALRRTAARAVPGDEEAPPLREAMEAVFAQLRRTVDRVHDGVANVRDAVERLHAGLEDGDHRLHRSQLGELRALLHETLERQSGLIVGTGVVFAPGVLGDAPRWLEWWCANNGGPPVFLDVSLSPEAPEFYDYESAEWFAVPKRTGALSIAGPFVDTSGTGQHIFTLTLPAMSRGAFLGVAGADMSIGAIEELAETALRAVAIPALLVNLRGTVIASNTSDWLVGTVWQPPRSSAIPEGPGWFEYFSGDRVLRDDALPWAVVAPCTRA